MTGSSNPCMLTDLGLLVIKLCDKASCLMLQFVQQSLIVHGCLQASVPPHQACSDHTTLCKRRLTQVISAIPLT